MNALLTNPLKTINNVAYEKIMMFAIPLLNFLSGLNIDLYAPSMPNIQISLHTSMALVQYSITVAMLGVASGCICFGVLFDKIGSRTILLLTLTAFFIVSLLAALSTSIEMLLTLRFIQGFLVAAVSIGSRLLALDTFNGKQFYTVMVYTSIAYGLGPILGPFIGGLIQYSFGWRANFMVYAIVALIIFVPLFMFVKQGTKTDARLTLSVYVKTCKNILTNPAFMFGVLLLASVLTLQIIYPTIGPFIVENVFGRSPIFFGYTALLISLMYLLGTLFNRFLLHKFELKRLLNVGFLIILLGFIMLCTIGSFREITSIYIIMLPIGTIIFGCGFVFSNILSINLKTFTERMGLVTSIQSFILMFIGSIPIYFISHIHIARLNDIMYIYIGVLLVQFLIYGLFVKAIDPVYAKQAHT
jgi:MFS family permease